MARLFLYIFTMLKSLKLLFALVAICGSFSFAVDTLEVYAFLVEFKPQENSYITGNGTFDSDTKYSYNLDPNGARGNHDYWEKHFEFVKAYYEAASNGKQTISWRIFPETSDGAYTLNGRIIDYNRTSKRKKEKVAEYDFDRSRLYMTFIHDAVKAANESESSPFKVKLPENPNTKRAYMIIHAGASGLVDGGSLGTNGANTPGDFIDTYVTSDYWMFLPKDSVLADTSAIDTLRGMPLKNAAIDTLKEIMVVSETANQDGLNWGINGIMVNQIGRSLGMPNTYDVVKGISRLGYFDVMDFAGYNAGNGFFPVLPSAWERSYMGWANVKTVTPKAGSKTTVEIAAAGSGLGTEIVKVPLSANEYLLIENRQRSIKENGEIEIKTFGGEETYTVMADSLATLFSDTTAASKKNGSVKPKGIVLSTTSYDAALPASGIVVWKVNEWYLKETLQFGVANFWGGDTLRDHQYGISLVEADSIVTIGKTFKNALGQDAFDYGSGADLIPHKRFSKTKTFETVYSIKSNGYGNTATLQGGYTGIKVSAAIPEKAREEKTSNAFMGDSVVTYASPKIKVTIEFEDLSIADGDFPKNVGLNNAPRAAVLLDYPSGSVREGEKMLVFASEDGALQAMSAFGEPLSEPDTIVKQKVVANRDSLVEVPLHILGKKSHGELLGIAATGDKVFTLHKDKLVRTTLSASLDMVSEIQHTIEQKNAVAGPIIDDGSAWTIAGNAMFRQSVNENSSAVFELPKNFKPTGFAACGTEDKSMVAVGEGATILKLPLATKRYIMANLPVSAKGMASVKNQKFNVVCSDFDRDGVTEAFVLGSQGYGVFVKLNDSLRTLDTPRQYDLDKEFSKPIVADVNNDGYPEAIFVGNNKVYAVNYKGIAIAGFPITFSKGTAEFEFQSEPLAVDVTGDSIPEILVPSNGGLLYAYKGDGKKVGGRFPLQAGTFEYGETTKPMSVFVGNAIDSLKGLELYAFHRNSVSAFRLTNSALRKTDWALPGNGNARTGFFDASVLKPVEEVAGKDEITEFYMYPNPVRGGIAKSRFNIGNDAKYAELEVFSVTGLRLMHLKLENPTRGMNQWDNIDLSKLGFNVYSVRLNVKFKSGKTKQKFYHVGVIQ